MYWDPFDEMERMHREMDRVFFHMVGGRPAIEHKDRQLPAKQSEFRPAVADCYETENAVIACFELPGATKDDIELNVTDNYVEVKVEKKQEKEKKGKHSYSYAVVTSQFYRRHMLPAGVEADKVKASYNNGVLRVEIPKKEKKT
ncbi:Hsp20/alpha crystallin family protein, partial [Candidatus Woesearchaeota archaeon]|nr:Hsp20/alpha crystallin family protein [Candidatus Woesearchaeota archaeon]